VAWNEAALKGLDDRDRGRLESIETDVPAVRGRSETVDDEWATAGAFGQHNRTGGIRPDASPEWRELFVEVRKAVERLRE